MIHFSPPSGCLQYWTGLTGRLATFGFDGLATAGSHAGPLDYTQCVRQEEGNFQIMGNELSSIIIIFTEHDIVTTC